MENMNELNEKIISYFEHGAMTKLDKNFKAGEEMARNTPAANKLIQKAIEADKNEKDRKKFFTNVIYQAFSMGAVVQSFNEGMERFEGVEPGELGIHETTDYKAFHILKGGRVPTEERVNTLIATIEKVGFIPAPIIVNEKFEIIDGACRVAACERLGLPVHYIIQNGAGVAQCVALHEATERATKSDFKE